VPIVTTSHDDIDALIARLSGPLLPSDREAFRQAALDALTRVPCWGEGAVYRAVASLQRAFFDPPPDARRANLGARHQGNKLSAQAAIGAPDPREGSRARKAFRTAG
jgi:hypothetical protein